MNLQTISIAIDSAQKYPYILKVGIFGSFARGEEGGESDVDIVLEYDDSDEQYLDDIGYFMEDVEQQINAKIDYVTLNALMRDKKPSAFRDEVLRDVKWLYQASV